MAGKAAEKSVEHDDITLIALANDTDSTGLPQSSSPSAPSPSQNDSSSAS